MLSSERLKPSKGQWRRVLERGELEQTIAAADEPYRTLFTVAALTGARRRTTRRSRMVAEFSDILDGLDDD